MRARRMALDHETFHALVNRLVEAILHNLSERSRLYSTRAIDPIGQIPHIARGGLDVECYDGVVRRVLIVVNFARFGHPLGNFVVKACFARPSEETVGHGTIAGIVEVDLREDRSLYQLRQYQHDLAGELAGVLVHELTHAQDRIPKVVADPTTEPRAGAYTRYANQPHEIRAAAREIAIEARRLFLIGRRRKRWATLTGDALRSVIEESSTWGRIGRHLTRANAAWITKYVARELSAIEP